MRTHSRAPRSNSAAADLLSPVAAMTGAVTSRDYERLFGRSFRCHRRHDRFITVNTADLRSVPWT
jgi:hypothetical protein